MNKKNRTSLSRLLIIPILILTLLPAEGQVRIAEFLAANVSTNPDPDAWEFSDWIELHNAGDQSVDLTGFYLTDDLGNPTKWQIPRCAIKPGQRQLFWADGLDLPTGELPPAAEEDLRVPAYHTSFKLNQNGEEIGLFAPDGTLVDSVDFGPQIADVSQGRQIKNGHWLFFAEPTPGTPNGNTGLTEPTVGEPTEFSLPAGFYSGAQTLILSHPHPDAVIRYTLDGSIPTSASAPYTASLDLAATTVLRVHPFVPGKLPGPVLTRTYFIDEEFTLPVFSISTDPENLWDDEIGIYVDGTNGIIADDSVVPKNSNQSWERPAHVEFYETDNSPAFSQQIGLSIYGAFSRHFQQKSLSVIARDKYGADEIRHRLFFDKPIDRFTSFILRNGGNDWRTTMIDDPFMQTLVEGRMDVDIQDYRPAILFLNGRYWGLHNIREKLNRYYPATNYGVDPNEVDIIEGDGLPKAGDAEYYRSTIDFLESHSLGDPESYERATRLIDVIEYMNVQIALIYYGPFDNFFKNVKCWRPRTPDGRLRWFLYDTDHGFGSARNNALEVATDPKAENRFGDISWGTLILRKLLESPEFKSDFIQRFSAHISYTFAPERVISIVDSLQAGIEPEMPRHIERWKNDCMEHLWWGTFCGIPSMSRWRSEVNRLRNFAKDRPAYAREHLRRYFDLPGMSELQTTVSEPAGGHILVNDVLAAESGLFFKEIPLRLKAEPLPGYRFAGWRGALIGDQPETTLVLEGKTQLEASFARIEPEPLITGLHINEIAASNDSLGTDEYGENADWIEIYNAGTTPIDIGGLYLTDRFDQPILWQIPMTQPDSTTIGPGQFLSLWADRDPEQGLLHADFRLDADGEQLALVQLRGTEAVYLDSFTFGSQETDITFGRYPDGADSLGQLSAPTPGKSNRPIQTLVSEEVDLHTLPAQFALHQNYPNPFNSRTTILYQLPRPAPVRLEIFSITGQRIATLVAGDRPAGIHRVVWKEEGRLGSGIYLYRLEAGPFVRTRRLLLIK